MSDIITYPENGITYDADDASGYLATRQSGVYSAEEDFAVSISGELSLTVSAGQAWVRPARFRGRSIIMEQPTTLALTAADPVRTRIDRVVLRYDAAARQTRLQVLEGTPDSASPTAPAITRTALVYDLCLAEVTRPAGSTAISAADLTDTRADEDVCGVMRDGVTSIPTAQLLAQWQAAQAAQVAAGQALLDQLRTEIKDGSAYSKTEADTLFALTADKITAALGYAPTRIISSTDAPPSDVSAYPDGTLWITYSATATTASADEAVDDTDIHIPEDETVADDSAATPEDTVQDETDTAETTVISDDAEPEEG